MQTDFFEIRPEECLVRQCLIDEIPLMWMLSIQVADAAEKLSEFDLGPRQESPRLDVDLFGVDGAAANAERRPDIEIRIDRSGERQLHFSQTETARHASGLGI